jgi:hypothetical protein
MSNNEGSPNAQTTKRDNAVFPDSFVIPSGFVIRASSFFPAPHSF